MNSFLVSLFLALVATATVSEARVLSNSQPFGKALLLDIPRGGGAIGPLDEDLVMQLSKTAATAYVAGSASKFIASKTTGSSPQLADFVTSELFASHALITAIACAMYGLAGTGFQDVKALAALSALGLALRLDSSGINLDTLQANKVQTLIAAALLFVAYVN